MNEMGGACSTYEGREEVHTGFWWGNLRKRGHLEDQGVNGRIILRRIFRKLDVGMGWIDLVQVRDMFRALLNTVMNLGVT
jgi:hypothetical protein